MSQMVCFSKIVEVVAEGKHQIGQKIDQKVDLQVDQEADKQDDQQADHQADHQVGQVDGDSCSLEGHSTVIVHQELLERSSDFFRVALSGDKWKEGKEKRIKVKASAAVLRAFGIWLYGRLEEEVNWAVWVDLYLFACQYVIDELASDLLGKMLSMATFGIWTPSIQQIEDIYESTPENSPLRSLTLICFSDSAEPNKRAVLEAAHESFVRQFAIYALPGPSDGQRLLELWKQCGQPSGRRLQPDGFDLEHTLRFRIQNSQELPLLHLGVVCKGTSSQIGDLTDCEVLGMEMIAESTFSTFASWLYFNDDLCEGNHGCQTCPDLMYLLDCYETALTLSSCSVKTAGRVVGEDAESTEHRELNEMLRSHGMRFRNCVIKAMVVHCQERQDVPSLDEVTRIYSITEKGDPIRRLIGDVFACRSASHVIDAPHLQFQCDLNASIMERVAELQKYVDQVRNVIDNVELDRGGRSLTKLGTLDIRMQEMADIKPPRVQQLDPGRYHV